MEFLSQYQSMLRIRLVEEAIAERYSEQQMRCPTHLSIGQEAVAVGISYHLTNSDKVFSSHRAHAHYLAKGGCLKKLIAELYGKATGCTAGRGGSMHLSDLDAGFVASTAIVANSIPLAVGSALHQKIEKKNEVSVAYFGDGAIEEGAFYEAANFAAVKQLPVLFVCENNQFSVYSDMSARQPRHRSITHLASAIGLQSLEVDGNDISQIDGAANELLNKIRSGHGPAFLECHTYRHREHCGPNFDDHLNYRCEAETKKWLEKDPVTLLSNQFIEQLGQESYDSLINEFNQEIDVAFAEAIAAPFPDDKDNLRFIYG